MRFIAVALSFCLSLLGANYFSSVDKATFETFQKGLEEGYQGELSRVKESEKLQTQVHDGMNRWLNQPNYSPEDVLCVEARRETNLVLGSDGRPKREDSHSYARYEAQLTLKTKWERGRNVVFVSIEENSGAPVRRLKMTLAEDPHLQLKKSQVKKILLAANTSSATEYAEVYPTADKADGFAIKFVVESGKALNNKRNDLPQAGRYDIICAPK